LPILAYVERVQESTAILESLNIGINGVLAGILFLLVEFVKIVFYGLTILDILHLTFYVKKFVKVF
jgi:hypothetical protein